MKPDRSLHPGKEKNPPLLAGKHVIILGAGASATSGYPLGEGLRQLLTDPDKLRKNVEEQLKEKFGEIKDGLDYSLKKLKSRVRLFRDGCFATVDEFLRLAGPHIGAEAENFRQILPLCFALHNPEESQKPEDVGMRSDYYAFIQRLFDSHLVRLRADIIVLTINYDPYLEFLLKRAYQARCEAKNIKPSDDVIDAILSGFQSRRIKKLVHPGSFSILKLHGTCALPSRHERDAVCPTHDEFFSADPVQRFRSVSQIKFADGGFSPIFFPWEIISESGRFIPKSAFRRADHRQEASDVELYPVFKAIWQRARMEVQSASKVSFVGISMHDYLKPGFRFLFNNKRGNADFVVADKKPRKPVERLERWLKGTSNNPVFSDFHIDGLVA